MKRIGSITYIVSNVDRFISFEWTTQALIRDGFKVSFILLNSSGSFLETFLSDQDVYVKRINYSSKKDLPRSIAKTYKYLKKDRPDIIHTHFPDGNLAGLIAGYLAGIKHRIHTRHHSTYHHDFHKKGVIIDKLINTLSTRIICISGVVYDVLKQKEHVNPSKLHLIHHGINPEYFQKFQNDDVKKLASKYDLVDRSPVIGVISRFIDWKGIIFIIRAFKEILEVYPNSVLVLANAVGPDRIKIEQELDAIPQKNFVEIEFEKQSNLLYQLFDVFVHVPIDKYSEAFGLVYVESLMAGVPSIFTLSGIANDFIIDNNNALVVDYENSEEIKDAIIRLLQDKKLNRQLIENGRASTMKEFSFDKMIDQLTNLYLNELNK